jgi:hypothetical protein
MGKSPQQQDTEKKEFFTFLRARFSGLSLARNLRLEESGVMRIILNWKESHHPEPSNGTSSWSEPHPGGAFFDEPVTQRFRVQLALRHSG